MTNSEDLNNNRTVINGVQDAVIPYSCPDTLLRPAAP